MSRSNPSLTKRPTTLPATKPPTRNSQPGQSAPRPPNEERVTVHHPAFSVICPDQKKRDRILKQAAKEEKAYEEHRRSNRPSHVSMTPRRLGSLHESQPPNALQDARRQQQQQQQQQQRLVTYQRPFQAAERARATKKQSTMGQNQTTVQSAEAEGKRLELMKLEAGKKTERNQTKTDLNAEQLRAKRLQFLGMQ